MAGRNSAHSRSSPAREDGFEYAEDFEIEVDPAAADQVSVIAGPTRPVAGGPRPYTVMYIERASIDADGILTVLGWAVSLGPTLAVQIFADERAPLQGQDPAASVKTSRQFFRRIRMHACPASA